MSTIDMPGSLKAAIYDLHGYREVSPHRCGNPPTPPSNFRATGSPNQKPEGYSATARAGDHRRRGCEARFQRCPANRPESFSPPRGTGVGPRQKRCQHRLGSQMLMPLSATSKRRAITKTARDAIFTATGHLGIRHLAHAGRNLLRVPISFSRGSCTERVGSATACPITDALRPCRARIASVLSASALATVTQKPIPML